jgi:UDP-3-O-[3-hydroxymyristoyl] glucosamine N-acyltransferase
MPNLKNIKDTYQDFIDEIQGELVDFENISPIDTAINSSLVFANNEKFLVEALHSDARVVITKSNLKEKCSDSDKSIVFTALPDLLVSHIIREYFYSKDELWNSAKGISSSAKVFSDSIGENVFIGENCIVEEDCRIGDNVYIGNNVVLQSGVEIGAGTVVMDQSIIYKNTKIGTDCIIRTANSLGTDSFEAKLSGSLSKGILKIGNNVETGSQVCIDRPIEGETLIANGCKLDNLIKIGPNVEIGENSLITAGVQIGAGSKIGRFFMIGGNSYVEPKTLVCDGVLCGGMTYVNTDITKPGSYGGNPVQPMRDYLKTLASLSQLPKLRKILKAR